MAKNKRQKSGGLESDGLYLLKLVFYLLLGSLWVRVSFGDGVEFGFPIGFVAGIILTMHERFRIDRKIEYAVLVIAMLFGYFMPYALHVNF